MDLQQALTNLQKARENQKKRQKRINLIAFPIGIVIGLLFAFAEDLFYSAEEGFTLLIIFAMLVTLPLQLILHELGHLIFGLFSGFRFVSFRVFSLAIYKKEGKLRFGRYRVAGTLGQCLMYPTSDDTPDRALHLGGVIVNSVTTVIFTLVLILAYPILPLRLLSIGMVFWGVLLALTNGIPQKNGIIANDGYNAKASGKDPNKRKLAYNQLRIMAAMTDGKRLCEMPEEWFTYPTENANEPLSVAIRAIKADRETDLARLDQAKEILLELANHGENLMEFHLSAVLSELLYLEMVGEHRPYVIETLRRELDRYFKMTQRSFTTLRIELTYHYLFTGDLETVAKLEKKFEKLKKHFPFTGEIAREELLISYPKAIYTNWRNSSRS